MPVVVFVRQGRGEHHHLVSRRVGAAELLPGDAHPVEAVAALVEVGAGSGDGRWSLGGGRNEAGRGRGLAGALVGQLGAESGDGGVALSGRRRFGGVLFTGGRRLVSARLGGCLGAAQGAPRGPTRRAVVAGGADRLPVIADIGRPGPWR